MDYLVHHGVLGQRWGIRRYQPYSIAPRGSGESGKEIGAAARAEKRHAKNLEVGGKRLNNRLNNLSKKSRNIDTALNPNARFDAIKYDQAIKNAKEILNNEKRTADVGKRTRRQTAINRTVSAAGGVLVTGIIAGVTGEIPLAIAVTAPVVTGGYAYVQSLINK
jgi:hypothetical protein